MSSAMTEPFGRQGLLPEMGSRAEPMRPMNRMNRKLQWSSVALVLPLAATLSGCKGEANVEQEIIRPVKAQVVGKPVRGQVLTYSGVVRPRIESAVGFRVAGKVVQRLINVGDRVEVNQVIARLDDTDLK